MNEIKRVKQKITDIVKEALKHRGFSEGETNQIISRLIRYGENAVIAGYPEIPFGRYKGISIDQIPHEYLNWLLSQSWFREKFDALYEDILGII